MRNTFSRLVFLALGISLGLAAAWLISDRAAGSVLADRFATFTTIFLGIFIEAAPFLLLGTLASGLVEVYLSPESLQRRLPRNPLLAALSGALMGFLFPVCECGTVPLTRRLFRKGLPLPVGIAFLLAAPVINPIVIFSTAAAFGWGPILAWRFGLSLLIASVTGLIFSSARKPASLLQAPALAPIRGGSGAVQAIEQKPTHRRRINRALVIAADEFFEMGRYLVAGALLAALMQTFVPQARLLDIGAGPLSSVLVMMALAVVLSICSTVDSFVALAFVGAFTPGSILAFLVFGPMIDIKSVLMFQRVFQRRTVVYLILLPLMMTLVAAVFLNLFVSL